MELKSIRIYEDDFKRLHKLKDRTSIPIVHLMKLLIEAFEKEENQKEG